jgi:hypothetical protein
VSGPFLRATSKRWSDPPQGRGCENIVELVSAAARDTDLTGVGSSPWVGDMGRTGIAVPAAPTTSQRNRYLFRLCGFEIPSGKAAILRGIRQLATIRHQETINDLPLVVEREIESPLWSFLDGNISWHLRRQPNQFSSNTQSTTQVAGTSFNMRQLDTALLCRVGGLPPAYGALNAGIPPGVSVDALGTWRDIRYPWTSTEWTLSRLFRGPGTVVLYASVAQTDPENRPLYPGLAGERPEDLFVSNFPDTARYGRVAGALIVELLPCCPESGAIPPGS